MRQKFTKTVSTEIIDDLKRFIKASVNKDGNITDYVYLKAMLWVEDNLDADHQEAMKLIDHVIDLINESEG